MRRFGWISLFVVLLMAACGPPEVHDINGGSGLADDDDGSDDDDDDDEETPGPTNSPIPSGSALPTLTNVPSFATWQSQIRPITNGGGCSAATSCHQGGSGGFYANTSNDPSNLKSLWFGTFCNRGSGNNKAGTQSFNPPAGRLQAFFRGQPIDMNGDGDTVDDLEVHDEAGINTGTTGPLIVNWFTAAGVTAPVPSCYGSYDLANSN